MIDGLWSEMGDFFCFCFVSYHICTTAAQHTHTHTHTHICRSTAFGQEGVCFLFLFFTVVLFSALEVREGKAEADAVFWVIYHLVVEFYAHARQFVKIRTTRLTACIRWRWVNSGRKLLLSRGACPWPRRFPPAINACWPSAAAANAMV
jgi:hypothetical protein